MPRTFPSTLHRLLLLTLLLLPHPSRPHRAHRQSPNALYAPPDTPNALYGPPDSPTTSAPFDDLEESTSEASQDVTDKDVVEEATEEPSDLSYVPPKTGDSSYVPPKTGDSSYVPPKTGDSSYVPPKAGDSSYVPQKAPGAPERTLGGGQESSYLPPEDEAPQRPETNPLQLPNSDKKTGVLQTSPDEQQTSRYLQPQQSQPTQPPQPFLPSPQYGAPPSQGDDEGFSRFYRPFQPLRQQTPQQEGYNYNQQPQSQDTPRQQPFYSQSPQFLQHEQQLQFIQHQPPPQEEPRQLYQRPPPQEEQRQVFQQRPLPLQEQRQQRPAAQEEQRQLYQRPPPQEETRQLYQPPIAEQEPVEAQQLQFLQPQSPPQEEQRPPLQEEHRQLYQRPPPQEEQRELYQRRIPQEEPVDSQQLQFLQQQPFQQQGGQGEEPQWQQQRVEERPRQWEEQRNPAFQGGYSRPQEPQGDPPRNHQQPQFQGEYSVPSSGSSVPGGRWNDQQSLRSEPPQQNQQGYSGGPFRSSNDLEGLNGKIVDERLLERVQQIIDEHERQQKRVYFQQASPESHFTPSYPPPQPPAPQPSQRQLDSPPDFQKAVLSSYFTQTESSPHAPQGSLEEPPRPSYGVPLAPALGLDSNGQLEDAVIVDSSRGLVDAYGRGHEVFRRRVGIVRRL